MDVSLLATSRQNFDIMPSSEATTRAIGMLRTRIAKLAADHHADMERHTLAWYDNLVNKYGTTLSDLEAERESVAILLHRNLKKLGYA